MAGRWTIEPGMGHATAVDRLYTTGAGTMPWAGLLLHATMLTLVIAVTVVVLLLTAGAVLMTAAALHEMVTGWDWAPLEDLFANVLHDMFTDEHGAPIF